MLIDTHAHLTFPEFIDLPDVISRAKAAGLEAIINIALDDDAIERSIQISKDYPGYVFMAAGTHPHEASQWKEEHYKKFKELAVKNKFVAIGETGLDYHYKLSPIVAQQDVFRHFLRMAQELVIPAVIHSRDAAQDTIKILKEENNGGLKGVLHCFAGDMELGKVALDMGLYISFTGNITFPKAEIIRQAVKQIPIERILIETDCPFLSPQPYRGKRNEPSYVIEVAKKIAEIKGLTVEEVGETTTNNAKTLFKI